VPGNELGIFEDLNDILDQKVGRSGLAFWVSLTIFQDLNQFFSETYPTIPKGTTPILKPVDGAPGLTSQANGGGESTLDFELAYPIVYPQSIVLFQTDDKPTEADYEYEGKLGYSDVNFKVLSYVTRLP
jgi:tripeptidyl-peptidase-1